MTQKAHFKFTVIYLRTRVPHGLVCVNVTVCVCVFVCEFVANVAAHRIVDLPVVVSEVVSWCFKVTT